MKAEILKTNFYEKKTWRREYKKGRKPNAGKRINQLKINHLSALAILPVDEFQELLMNENHICLNRPSEPLADWKITVCLVE